MKKRVKGLKRFVVAMMVFCMGMSIIPSLPAEAADKEGLSIDMVDDLVGSYMDGRKLAVSSGHTEILEDVAVKGIVDDEVEHRFALNASGISISDSAYQITEVELNDTMTFVSLNETVEYVTNGVLESMDVEHNLTVMFDETGEAKIVSDSYIETASEFQSCSYVSGEMSMATWYARTDDDRTEIVSIAEAEVGYKEKKSNEDLDDFTANAGKGNYTKYGRWYGSNGVAWCAIFVSWCANEAGVSTSVIPKYASCSTGMKKFKEFETFYYSSAYGGNYTPQAGDIFFTGTSATSSSHTGIVVAVSDTEITVVDGNWSNQVSRHTYSLTDSSLIGFACPNY